MTEYSVPEIGDLVAGRYAIEQPIGRGGMAIVYQAFDNVSGERVALKQLRVSDLEDRTRRDRELFEHEFHTLVQLAHPRIVSALDYGIEAGRAYYTMELLDGGDLSDRAPVPWQEACALARDICSALSLVHSRRLVYRDVSPRNVRCTADGKAKLIDFGALAPMGSTKSAVCTPAVAAPEVAHWQPLDGRSDLYALGATLYYALTGQNAYPARSFRHLDDLWREPLRRPSHHVPDVPKALDALVMDLLQLDPQGRPASAFEVGQRLSAIAGLETDEHLLSSQAYLTTPVLVGRDRQLDSVQRRLKRLRERGKGSAILVRAPSGSGRSRFLDACALEAKLAGLTVLRTSPAEASEGTNAAASALIQQLREALPEQAGTLLQRHLNDAEPQAAGQAGLRDLFFDVAGEKPLLITIDDVEHFDAESRALVALLAHGARNQPLVVLAATDSEAPLDTDAAHMLSEASRVLALPPLTAEETHALLASIFGDVPNLAALVRRVHALAEGNPQDIMRVAQHLLDRGIARFGEGTWTLPDRIDDAELPGTMAQALEATVATLDDDARSLAEPMAHFPGQRFFAEECLALATHEEPARLFASIDRLVAAGVVAATPDGYMLANKAWAEPLRSGFDPQMHARLARVFSSRDDGLRAAGQLFRAGREAEGLDALVAFSVASTEKTNNSTEAYAELLATLPDDWREILETGIRLCREHDRPAHDVYMLQRRAAGFLGQSTLQGKGLLVDLADDLARAVGLDIYASLDATLEPGQRLQQALAGAAARYAETPERKRLFDPKTAIGELARLLIAIAGNISRTLDVEAWQRLPSIAPLAPLSPAVALVSGLMNGVDARVSGRFELACDIYEGILDEIERAKSTDLDRTYIESTRGALFAIMGTLHAALGLESAEGWADRVATDPLHHGSALAIRMLDRLWQGDTAGAARLAREWELWRLEQPRQQSAEVVTLLWALQVHAASDDLTRTRETLESIERVAGKVGSWEPIAAWARGEYERIRGDHAAALAALDDALAQMQPGRHQIWPLASGARLKVLCEQERYAEARSQGEADLAAAEAHGLGYIASYIRMPLAHAVAKLGDAEAAWGHVHAVLEGFDALGTRGLNRGLAHEAAARVASALGDAEAFQRHADLCKASYFAHPNPALAAKHRRLLRIARRSGPPGTAQDQGRKTSASLVRSQIESVLQTCASPDERLRRGLEFIVRSSGAREGFLYTLVDGAPSLRAQTGAHDAPPEVDRAAQRYFEQELSDDTSVTASGQASSSRDRWTSLLGASQSRDSGDSCYRPFLLSHRNDEGFLISGLVVLELDCNQHLRAASEMTVSFSQVLVELGDLQPRLVAT